MNFGIAGVAAITVIAWLIGETVKNTGLDNKWIPVICGLCGGVLGMLGMKKSGREPTVLFRFFLSKSYIRVPLMGIFTGVVP